MKPWPGKVTGSKAKVWRNVVTLSLESSFWDLPSLSTAPQLQEHTHTQQSEYHRKVSVKVGQLDCGDWLV